MARPFYNPRFHVNPHPNRGLEKLSDEVITEPDLSVTVEDIYSRYVRGMPISGLARPVYFSSDDDDDDFVDPAYRQNLDLTDFDEFGNEMKGYIESTSTRLKHSKTKLDENVDNSDNLDQ